MNVGSLRLCLLSQLSVVLDSTDELLSRSGKRNVLDAEVDTLLDVSVLDLLVDDDTDGALRDVVDDTGLACDLYQFRFEFDGVSWLTVIDFVRHSVLKQLAMIVMIYWSRGRSYPFWTAPFALISTMSPTLP